MEGKHFGRAVVVSILIVIFIASAYRLADNGDLRSKLVKLTDELNAEKAEARIERPHMRPQSAEEININISAVIKHKKVETAVEPENVDYEMNKRIQVLRRTCKLRRKIQNLVDARDFDALLELHELVFDLSRDLPADDTTPVICNTPSLVAPQESQAKYDMRRKKQHIDIFREQSLNLTICLPPKCGTTNWQYALSTLNKDGPHGRGFIPSLDPEHFKSFEKSEHDTFVLNTRHPFERLLSAWRDKFLLKHSPKRQGYFLPSIKHFEDKDLIPSGYGASFEAFAQFRAANPSDYVHNRHWRTITHLCNPCHFTYDMVLHLENVQQEYDWAWKKIGGEPPKMRDQYSASPLKKHDRTYYWRNIPKNAIRELYIIYYMDFVALGYPPSDIEEFINAGADTEWDPKLIIAARESTKYHDQEKLSEICYR